MHVKLDPATGAVTTTSTCEPGGVGSVGKGDKTSRHRRHVFGKVKRVSPEELPKMAVASEELVKWIQAECPIPVDTVQVVMGLDKIEIVYRGAFDLVRQAWRNEAGTRSLARLQLPQGSDMLLCHLPAALIDGCLRSAMFARVGDQKPQLPLGIASLVYSADLKPEASLALACGQTAVWGYAEVTHGVDGSDSFANCRLIDDDGEVLMTITNLRLGGAASRDAWDSEAYVPSGAAMYSTVWAPVPLPPPLGPDNDVDLEHAAVIRIAGKGATAPGAANAAIKAVLPSQVELLVGGGGELPTSEELAAFRAQFKELASGARKTLIVDGTATHADSSDPVAAEAAANWLLVILQEMAGGKLFTKMVLLTTGAVAFDKPDAKRTPSSGPQLNLIAASLFTMLRSARLEFRNVEVVTIDLCTSTLENVLAAAPKPFSLKKLLGRELGTAPIALGEPEAAYLDGKRHTPRLATDHVCKFQSTQTTLAASVLFKKGIYDAKACFIISGGTGAVGLLTACLLADSGARNVVLMSRRGTLAYDDQPQLTQMFRRLQKSGCEVKAVACDVGDAKSVKTVLEGLRSQGLKIAGIVHSAGQLLDAPLATQSPDHLGITMRVRCRGATNLHNCTQGDDLSFFMLVSSITGLIGNRGQANYAAANGWMDGFAAWRNRQGLPCTALQLCGVKGAGVAASVLSDAQLHAAAAISLESLSLGLVSVLSSPPATPNLPKDYLSSRFYVVSVMSDDSRKILPGINAPLVSDLRAIETKLNASNPADKVRHITEDITMTGGSGAGGASSGAGGDGGATPVVSAGGKMTEAKLQKKLLDVVKTLTQGSMKDAEMINAELDSLGVDSLGFTELVSEINNFTGLDVSLAFALECGTIAKLAKALHGMVEDRDGPSGGDAPATSAVAPAAPAAPAAPLPPPEVVFLFTGQGCQYKDMCKSLYQTDPVFKKALDDCDRALADPGALDGVSVLKMIYGGTEPGDDKKGAGLDVNETEFAQPCIFAVEVAMARVWLDKGIKPMAVLGHSIGEYAAAHIAGILSLEDAATSVVLRGRMMGRLPNTGHQMAAVSIDEATALAAIEASGSTAAIGAINGPRSLVLSGLESEVQKAVKQMGCASKPLVTSHAFHSPLMQPVVEPLQSLLGSRTLNAPKVRFYSTALGYEATAADVQDPAYWGNAVVRPVRFAPAMAAMIEDSYKGLVPGAVPNPLLFVEMGPRAHLAKLGKQCSQVQPPATAARVPVTSTFLATLDPTATGVAAEDQTAKALEQANALLHPPAAGTAALGARQLDAGPRPEVDFGNVPISEEQEEMLGATLEGQVGSALNCPGAGMMSMEPQSFEQLHARVESMIRTVLIRQLVLRTSYVFKKALFVGKVEEDIEKAVARIAIGIWDAAERRFVTGQARSGKKTAGSPGEGELELTSSLLLQIGVPKESMSPELLTVVHNETCQPLDPATGPVLSLLVVRLSPTSAILLTTVHHVALDGMSMSLLASELLQGGLAYKDPADDKKDASAVTVAPLEANWTGVRQYYEYALAQHAKNSAAKVPGQKAPPPSAIDTYWTTHLEGAPDLLPLMLDKPRPRYFEFKAGYVQVELDAELVKGLHDYSKANKGTVFQVMLMCYALMLGKYANVKDVVIGVPFRNRKGKDFQTIGHFMRVVPMRVSLLDDKGEVLSLGDLLKRVRDIVFKGVENCAGKLPAQAHNPGYHPLYQTVFNCQIEEIGTVQAAAGGALAGSAAFCNLPVNATFMDIDLSLYVTGSTITGYMKYCTSLFEHSTIKRMEEHFKNLVRDVVKKPAEASAWSVTMFGPTEETQLIKGVHTNKGQDPFGPTLQEMFVKVAQKTPSATALLHKNFPQGVSYGTLLAASVALAKKFKEAGMKDEDLVLVVMPKSPALLSVYLGAWMAGGGVLPVPTDFPLPSIQRILDLSGCKFIATNSAPVGAASRKVVESLTTIAKRIDVTEPDASLPASGAALEAPFKPVSPKNLSYVLFTSGTTGAPKGVMVQHDSIAHQCWNSIIDRETKPGVVQVMASAVATDTSVFQAFTTLCAGATLVMMEKEDVLDGIRSWPQVTMIDTTPSVLTLLSPNNLPNLSLLVMGGEKMDMKHICQWMKDKPNLKVCNEYGPTEVTVIGTRQWIERGAVNPDSAVYIGKALPGYRLYILDEDLKLQPFGVPGQVVIGGVGVARGYLGREDLTNKVFLPDPFFPDYGRMYLTGDYGRILPGGVVQLKGGRGDRQIKLHGQRVELDEVELALRAVPGVETAHVLAVDEGAGHHKLHAFLTPGTLNVANVRKTLTSGLPAYMVPAAITVLAVLPTNTNGKIDEKELRKVHATPGGGGAGATAAVQLLPAIAAAAGVGAIAAGAAIASKGFDAAGGATGAAAGAFGAAAAPAAAPFGSVAPASVAPGVLSAAGVATACGVAAGAGGASAMIPAHLAAEEKELQQVVLDRWNDLLGETPSPVGIEDDFFAVGGMSILAGRLAASLRQATDLEFSAVDVYEQRTVAAQARLLLSRKYPDVVFEGAGAEVAVLDPSAIAPAVAAAIAVAAGPVTPLPAASRALPGAGGPAVPTMMNLNEIAIPDKSGQDSVSIPVLVFQIFGMIFCRIFFLGLVLASWVAAGQAALSAGSKDAYGNSGAGATASLQLLTCTLLILCLVTSSTVMLAFFKLVLPAIQPGSYPLYSYHFLVWWAHRLLDQTLIVWQLPMMRETRLLNIVLRFLGARVGSDTVIDTAFISDFQLLTFGADCVVEEESDVRPSVLMAADAKRPGGALHLYEIRIGREAVVGHSASVSPGTTIPDGCKIEPMSGKVVWGPTKGTSAHPEDPDVPGAKGGIKPTATHQSIFCEAAMVVLLLAAHTLTLWPVIAATFNFKDGRIPFPDEWDGFCEKGAAQWFVMPWLLLLGWPLGFIICIVIFKIILIGRFSEDSCVGEMDWWWRWRYTTYKRLLDSPLYGWAHTCYGGTVLCAWYMRVMGAQIGRRVFVTTAVKMTEFDLISVGDDAFITETLLMPAYNGKVGHVEVSANTLVANGSVLGPGTKVGNNSIVGQLTFTAPDTKVPADVAFFGPDFFFGNAPPPAKGGEGKGGGGKGNSVAAGPPAPSGAVALNVEGGAPPPQHPSTLVGWLLLPVAMLAIPGSLFAAFAPIVLSLLIPRCVGEWSWQLSLAILPIGIFLTPFTVALYLILLKFALMLQWKGTHHFLSAHM